MCGAELPDLPDFKDGAGDGDKSEEEGRDLKKKKADSKSDSKGSML